MPLLGPRGWLRNVERAVIGQAVLSQVMTIINAEIPHLFPTVIAYDSGAARNHEVPEVESHVIIRA